MSAEDIRKIITLLENVEDGTSEDSPKETDRLQWDPDRLELVFRAIRMIYIKEYGISPRRMDRYIDLVDFAPEWPDAEEYLYNSKLTSEQLQKIARSGKLPSDLDEGFPFEISVDTIYDTLDWGRGGI